MLNHPNLAVMKKYFGSAPRENHAEPAEIGA
jgi:hypothetical protein